MIRQNRLAIIFGIGILLLVAAVAYLESEADKGDGRPSSYSNLRNGGKAAYLFLQQGGYPVERWERSPKDLPADGNGILLIIADPISFPTTEESAAFSHFLSHGGSVLVAGILPDAFVSKAAATYGEGRIGGEECKAVAPTRLTRGGSISLDGDLEWDSTDSSQLVHFADPEGKEVVVSYPVGGGSVVWWASALPLENSGVREKNNLELLMNSTSGYKRVLWDEFFQESHRVQTRQKSVRAYSWALAQLVVIGVAVVLTYSRRSGPQLALIQQSRASPLEFVETLASVFRRARSSHVAVEIAFQRFRQVAARRLGIRGTSNAAEIVDTIVQRGIRISESTATLIRQSEWAANDATLTERAAIAFVRALNEATQAMDPALKVDFHPLPVTNDDTNKNFPERT